jgi:hypothetical protein
MAQHHPPTVDQIRQAKLDLAEMKKRAEEMAGFMSAGYGFDDPRAIRAQELAAAFQRLLWELERGKNEPTTLK